MFTLNDRLELRRMTISSLLSCIYLPGIVTVVSYKGLLYTIGNASSFYVLVLIFIAELLKFSYLEAAYQINVKKNKANKNRVSDIAKSLLFLLGTTFTFFIGIILFGAPVKDSHEETLMLSSLLTLLAVFPLVAQNGVEASIQLMFGSKSYAKDTVIDMLITNALLTICGAWLGALVIPLDWNKPWQQWPIPCYLGAIGGYLLANVLNVVKISLISASCKYPNLQVIVNIMNRLHWAK